MIHIKNKQKIKTLKFEGFVFQSESVEYVSQYIQDNRELKQLALKDCCLTNQGRPNSQACSPFCSRSKT